MKAFGQMPSAQRSTWPTQKEPEFQLLVSSKLVTPHQLYRSSISHKRSSFLFKWTEREEDLFLKLKKKMPTLLFYYKARALDGRVWFFYKQGDFGKVGIYQLINSINVQSY